MKPNKVNDALKRLNLILPLKENQQACSSDVNRLHQDILLSCIAKGRFLSKEEMSHYVGDVSEAIDVLSKRGLVTLNSNGDLIGAYPFSRNERNYAVQVNEYKLYAMCALDALAIAPMFKLATQITSRCGLSGDVITIKMDAGKILNIDKLGHVQFGISWDAADSETCCADSLCREMIFICGDEAAEKWLVDATKDRQLFTLQEAVQFADKFFSPLMA
ncbi:MAG: hypothetical protein JKX87_01075 [Cycloclasticus sp.]|nr:hypothetical protein [Cycloclasticus sp.]